MKILRRHIIFFILSVAVIQSCSKKTALPDLHETFGYRDDRPFGGSVAYHIFQSAFPGRHVEQVSEPFNESNGREYDTSSVYFSVSRNFLASNEDAEAILDFVYKGNSAFISAEYIDTVFLNKLFCSEINLFPGYDTLQHTSLGFTPEIKLYKDSFRYFYYPFKNYFPSLNNSYGRAGGRDEKGNTNFFVFFWGKGRIYFQCEPRALSNYFLLTGNNYRYMEEIMRMMPATAENIYWDNYQNTLSYRPNARNKNFSTLSALMSSPALSKAFLTGLFLLLLFIFFNGKRRQRIVPKLTAPENTTVAFAEAMAGLYLSKKDNKLISDKIITYFNEHVRSKYFMALTVNDAGYDDLLSRKSGVPLDITGALADTIRNISLSEKISDQQLLVLNNRIEKFFKNKT